MKKSWLVLTLAIPGVAAAQQPQPRQPERVVVVTAHASVEKEPERAVLLLSVESTGTTARAAAQANATKMEAVVAALRRLGITGRAVRTQSYELHPQYARPPREDEMRGAAGPPRITGYLASNMVHVSVDTVAKVGGVIDAAIAAGANRVAGLHFELRDPEAARRDALRLAVEKARAEAEVLATAAGQRLGPPLEITTGGYAEPRFSRAGMARDMVMEAAAPPPTPVEPGTLSIMASVTITYRLEGS